MIPQRNRYSGQSGPRYNYFDAALLGVPGAQDWQIAYHTPVLGLGRTGWQIDTQDPALAARLEASGIIARLARLGQPTISYSKQRRALQYSEDVTPRWAPTPERFGEQLELLLLLAQAAEQANKGATSL